MIEYYFVGNFNSIKRKRNFYAKLFLKFKQIVHLSIACFYTHCVTAILFLAVVFVVEILSKVDVVYSVPKLRGGIFNHVVVRIFVSITKSVIVCDRKSFGALVHFIPVEVVSGQRPRHDSTPTPQQDHLWGCIL